MNFLKRNPDYMAIATNKGLGASLIEHTTYNNKLWSEHLSDRNAYKEIPPNQMHAMKMHMKYKLGEHLGDPPRTWANISYRLIGRPIRADKKSICQRTRRATINPRQWMKSSRRGEFRSSRYIFCGQFLTSYFLKQVKVWPQQKYTQQIWIRLVEYSSSKVSGPSEVPRFVFKLIF